MTITEAINEAITQLEGVRLPIRDRENIARVQTALNLLDALKATVETKQTDRPDEPEKGEDAE